MSTTGCLNRGLGAPECNFLRFGGEKQADGANSEDETDFCLCLDFMKTSKNPLPEDPTTCQKMRYAFMCPPHGIIGSYISSVFIFAILYCVLWSLFEEEALPHRTIFEVWLHFVTSIIGGYIVHLINLPPLLGMILMGIVIHIVPHERINKTLSFTLRNTALTVILIRAGLGLNPTALKKLSFAVLRLAFLPCLVEAISAAIFSHLLLDLPIIWGLMLGFVLAAVSPAIVMPCLLHFQELGYGVDKGIPTLLIAAASIDDVLAITGFGVSMGIAFAEGDIILAFFKGPLEAILGVVLGAILGVLLWYLPPQSEKKNIFLRGFTLFSIGLMGIIGCPHLDLPGTGPLLCLTVASVAAIGWRKEQDQRCLKLVMKSMALLWFIFQPLLFGLIGAEMNLHQLSIQTISYGIATLIIGLVFRGIMTFIATFGTTLILKEKCFVAMAWIPKATVQAAIGSMALSAAEDKNRPEFIEYGQLILEMAVLAILITAPLGAVLVVITGPRLLKRVDPMENVNPENITPQNAEEEEKEEEEKEEEED